MNRSHLIAAALATVLFAGFNQANAQTTTTVAVPPPGGIYQPDYGNQTFSIGIEGMDVGNAVEVRQVFMGTAAHRLGLEAGDRILKVNGRMTPNLASLRQAVTEAGRNSGGHIAVLIDNVRARRGEYGAQRFVIHSTQVDRSTIVPPAFPSSPSIPSGPMIVTPNQIDGYNPNTGQLHSSNVQIDHSATDPYREFSRDNGTRRYVKRPIYDTYGNLVGFQEGEVWNNSLTGQEHGVLNNTTVDQNGNVHQQRQITRQIIDQ